MSSASSDSPPSSVLDIKAFLNALGNRPVFTRDLFEHSKDQLERAKRGLEIELKDCYGTVHQIKTNEASEATAPRLFYGNYHQFADPESFEDADDLEELVEFAKFPIFILPIGIEPTEYCNLDQKITQIEKIVKQWDESAEHKALSDCLYKMKDTARITKLVCIGHGSVARGDLSERMDSVLQHIAAASMAKEVTAMYEQSGTPLNEPITIIAQDPVYTRDDETILSHFPVPISIVPDPYGFLAIDEFTLVMSLYPSVPVKQIVADLAAKGKGPAAIFWNDDSWDIEHGGVDIVTYQSTDMYFANAGSRRLADMLGGYVKVMDGNAEFDRSNEVASFDLLQGAHLWARSN